MSELCPHPFDKFKNISDAELQNRVNFYYENFRNVKEYVEKNKKFPEFKEDFSKIKKDEQLFEKYRLLKKNLEKSSYHQNKDYIKRKLLKNPNDQILIDFLDLALEYQRENLAWFSKAQWFNRYSSKIFEDLALKGYQYHGEENKENFINVADESLEDNNIITNSESIFSLISYELIRIRCSS